jgi:hypothetical protein
MAGQRPEIMVLTESPLSGPSGRRRLAADTEEKMVPGATPDMR